MDAQVKTAFNSTTVGKLTFYSPGTFIIYNAQKFNVIRELIRQGNVATVPKRHWGGAQYHNIKNELVFNSSEPENTLTPLLLHEFTHVIQDWMDIKSTVGGLEADAYIVQYVAFAHYDKSNADLKSSHPAKRAAAMVLNKTATRANAAPGKDWLKTYKEVVKKVLTYPKYSRQAPNADRNEGNGTERALFNKTRKNLKS